MNTGRLRERIIIQTYSDSSNDYGETVKNWTTFATVFAGKRSVTGREYIQNDKVKGEVSHVFRIRYLDGVQDKMRILLGSRVFEIRAVLPDRIDEIYQDIVTNEQTS